jgi:glycosyltransferase involved in cell wall biosynthesis
VIDIHIIEILGCHNVSSIFWERGVESFSLKVSIITVVRNAVATIQDTIFSVASQNYKNIEHIIIDGDSTDGTLEIIRQHQDKLAYVLSEADRGIYDAMNKGIQAAQGDFIGFLNSDDIYASDQIISKVVAIVGEQKVDAVYGDLVYVSPNNLQRVHRHYNSGYFNSNMIAKGYMPAHPTLFLRNSVFKEYGDFKIDYSIAADFEFVARVFGKDNISYYYLPEVMVKMRQGGASTKNLKSNWILNKEILRACKENDIKTNILKVLSKYPQKILGLRKEGIF